MGKQVSAWKNAPIVEESNGVDTIEEPKWKSAPVVEEPVKKKGNTLSAPVSPKPSTVPGSEESGAASEQPTKPSGKAIVNPLNEGLNNLFSLFSSAGKTALSTLKNTLPQAIDYLNTSENFNPPQTYEEKIADQYSNEAFKNGISKADQDALKKFALNKRTQLVGEAGIKAERLLHDRDIKDKKVEARKIFEEHNTARIKELEGIPQTYRDVKDIESGIKYGGGLVGQALASFPLILTGGASEGADAYYEGVDEKAKKLSETIGKKVTPEEVIKLGLDKDAQNHALGVQFINGALDVVGFETILGSALKKQIAKEGGKELVKKGVVNKLKDLSKPAFGEALTETAQELDTFVQSRLAAGRSKEEIGHELKKEYPRLIDAALGGLVGGVTLGGGLQKVTPQQAVSNAKDQIASTSDIKSVEDHAAKIIESVKQAPEEGVKNAIQEQSPSGVLQHPQEGVGETGSGRGRVESSIEGKEIAGTHEQNEGITSPEKTEENLNTQPNENDTGIRGTVSETGIQTEQGKGNQESGRTSGLNRKEKVRSEENGGVRREGQETTQQINQHETEQVSRGSEQESTAGKTAEDVIRGVHEAIQSKQGEKTTDSQVRKQEESVLEEEAKKQGHWIESPEKEPHAQGQEQVVYLDDSGKTVTKINTGVMHSTWKDFMDRINRHNEMFPDVAYKVKGFTKVNGEFGIVLEQPVVKGEAASEQEIKDDLEKRGFKQWGPEPLKRTTFHSKEAGVTLKDVHNDNVIKDEEGNLRYIDTMNEPYDEAIYGEENAPVKTFKTAKGSEYTVEGNKTTRNKAKRPEHTDSGVKEQSLATVYLTPKEQEKAQIIYAQGQDSRQINRIGDEIHIIDKFANGKEKTTKIKFSKQPEIGLHPFEVFQDGNAHLGNVITEINGQGAKPPVQTPKTPSGEEQPQGKQFALAKRIEASDVQEPVKAGVRAESTYTPKGLNITEAEAQKVIDDQGVDATEAMVKDPSNNLTSDQRVVISGKLYENYVAKGQNVKAVDIAIWAENFLMQAGRAANAGKFWKMITSSGEDQIVLAIERQQERNQQSALTDIDRSKTKAQLEAEFRRLVEEKVQSTVESRLEAAKLITKEKRKEIGDFFDNLKVDTKNNIASAALLPIGVLPHVWNAAVDVIKQAVLTGADVANAIQAGIDHIKANQKEPFDEQKFRDEFTPEVQKIMPRKKIKASDIDPSKIKTPKIIGKKKIDFINKVVDSFNKGELTDKKFDEIYASKLGFREFTFEDRAKIRKLAKTIAESEKFDDQLRALPADQFTRENIEKMKGLREAARQANKDLQEYSQAPANVWDTLIAVMQANLMSSMSLVSNVWYNLTYSPLRATSTGIASMLDYGMSKMAKIGLMPKAVADRTIDFGALQKGYVQGLWNGTLEGLKQLKTGPQADEANLREIHSKFNPGKAIDRWTNDDRTLKQKANDYIEGTIGWEAETMFRLLNLGDKPFKRAAEMARTMEIGAQKGLKGKELEKFILLPDAESEAQIVQSGKEATFQQDTQGGKIVQNALSQFLNFVSTIPVIGGPAKVIIKSQIPFVKTPMNLIIETIQYATPPATFATGIYQIAKGNKRSGSVLVGKAIVGSMLWNAATMLFLKGLLTGDDDKDKKKRDFQLDKTPPPNSLNTSAISRGLAFQGWDTRDGDTWVSYSKMGVAGICLDNYANIYKERIANNGDISGGPETFLQDMMQSAPRVASSTIEQSFLQGTSSALEALKSGDDKTMNNWLVKTTESVGSILYPNTIATIAKASDDYLRDTNDPEFLGRLKNVYKAKMFMGDELPPKVSLWGDKVTGNPEGRNKYAYYLFDPSKFKDISTDDFRFKLYNAFKSDYDADWLPSMPQRSITVDGEKVKLTPKEYAELSINVGKERAALTSSYINSTDQISKDELKMRYDEGYELGKEKFMIDHGMNVKYKFRKPLELRSMTKKLNKSKVKF